MSLTVLTDAQAKSVLDNLTVAQLLGFQKHLSKALREYSTNTQSIEDGTYHQPPRTRHSNPRTGATTLFMPSIGPTGMGIKVVTLSTPGQQVATALPAIKPTGAIMLFAPDGTATGLLHAGAVTAFRTALASSCLVNLRSTVRDIVVFGAGKQAYWHVRLALMQKGSTAARVTVINRNKSTAQEVLKDLDNVPSEVKTREGWQAAKLDVLSPDTPDYKGLLQQRLQEADIIFCCTPSTEDLFDGSILTSGEGRKKTRLVVAVGSYTPDMRELPEELLLQSAKAPRNDPLDGGAIVVDTLEGVMTEAGEIIHAKIGPSRLVELGEVVDLDQTTSSAGEAKQRDEVRARWLGEGNVIYKSVGLGLMDLVVGGYLIEVASEGRLGTRIEGF